MGLEPRMTLGILLPQLLIPAQSVTMSGNAGNHVVQAVPIDVVGIHLGAAARTERRRVSGPGISPGGRGGLRPPAVLVENVETSIPVDVADPEPVRKTLPVATGRDRGEWPLGR